MVPERAAVEDPPRERELGEEIPAGEEGQAETDGEEKGDEDLRRLAEARGAEVDREAEKPDGEE